MVIDFLLNSLEFLSILIRIMKTLENIDFHNSLLKVVFSECFLPSSDIESLLNFVTLARIMKTSLDFHYSLTEAAEARE